MYYKKTGTDTEHLFLQKSQNSSVQRIGTDTEHFGDRYGAFDRKQKTGEIVDRNHTRFEYI